VGVLLLFLIKIFIRWHVFLDSIQKIPMIPKAKTSTLRLTSPLFKDGGEIPSRYTCEGENINPPLQIANIPPETKCLAIIVEDPDAPKGLFVHWIAWDIPVTTLIGEDSAPGTPGINGFKHLHYGGPCPPAGTHRYFFKIYALSQPLGLAKGSDMQSLLEAMDDHVIGYGELVGLYGKKNPPASRKAV
jgi:Raf kinase inhibitor-like YbhB/YbcL family protein